VEWEIVCVDDGSRDETGNLLEEIAAEDPRIRVLHHRRNFGQGRALRTAFDACGGEVVVTLDADLSYGPEYIYRLADALDPNNAEIALASPYMKGGAVHNVPLYRHALSRVGNWYLARMSHYPISTSTCVVRAYRREVIDGLTLSADGMELQLEILLKASMSGFRVCEIPASLAWADDRVAEADLRRVSKMRILRTIRLYLLMGWLSRPAFVFLLLSMFLLVPGTYMGLVLLARVAAAVVRHLPEGAIVAVSNGLEEVFTRTAYSIAFCSALLVIGLQLFAFSLLLLQNKFYFDELYRLVQARTTHREAVAPGGGDASKYRPAA
jgi:glycosyltransferase involved in cell wall biosynthesis